MQGSPPLPIWLCEHEAPIRLPPPRRSGGLWQRLVKFFWACAVAAPIAYVFAITTSPLHKPLVEMAGLGPAISAWLPTLLRDEHSRGRDLIAIAPMAGPEDSTGVGSGGAEPAATPSGIAAVAAIGAQSEPARPATAAEAVTPDADRASAPDAARASSDQPVVATIDAGVTRPTPSPAPAGEPGPKPAMADPAADTTSAVRQDASGLTAQGKQFFETGDLVAARILFMRAVKAGDAAAAVAMGATYDPVVLAERGVFGVPADLDKARAWYGRAQDMGSSEGPRRLEMLANR